MIFLINILNIQVSIITSKSKLPILLVLSFSHKKFLEVYIYTFSFDRVKFGASSLTFKDKNSILM